jgi:magnesium chelatase accessory protein
VSAATLPPDWPHAERSRFVDAGGLRWHVQAFGEGEEALVLLHGTGASAHSFRALAPRLAAGRRVLVPDLPGHGFSEPLPSRRSGMEGMGEALGALLAVLGARPRIVLGHSAGAALLARACLDGRLVPERLVSLGGALLPLDGTAGLLFPPAARLLAGSGLLPRWVSRRAEDPRAVGRLLAGTGSRLDAEGVALYRRLLQKPEHVAGALRMMAAWDLPALARDLPRLDVPVTLVHADEDRTLPVRYADRLLAALPRADAVRLPGLGHLAHEERPETVARLLATVVEPAGAPPSGPAVIG